MARCGQHRLTRRATQGATGLGSGGTRAQGSLRPGHIQETRRLRRNDRNEYLDVVRGVGGLEDQRGDHGGREIGDQEDPDVGPG